MKLKPNYFKESKPITSFKWVMDNCTVKVITEEQRDFINSKEGQKLMDQLFDSKNQDQYFKIAYQIEEIMESLSGGYKSSLCYQ
ncbi:hypothetical protein OQJ19_11280 [Fluoribacter gormanii]|uniref:Uncharacterized protein n=1 Tax=Fluoribacter gormanii TaxID=464 RepID=A0A377GLD2_9GAMM|nr:hypothetical protein [Fluoribacter gormanii]KTD05010.1 hypothetical protein Lgor_0641 [Fluoribacter gormanii]MCW8442752.1 hypothetical protein [Fluoribacter gormanii]MCW8471226.1 hypothetical protein [Fluoribacter gormanii]SIR55985.1 hypothetical protein SAMN05421777_11558 [Fluoribacter gormanii]STO25640.1 Uncharacterised protein [Fluoribacter gormanii]